MSGSMNRPATRNAELDGDWEYVGLNNDDDKLNTDNLSQSVTPSKEPRVSQNVSNSHKDVISELFPDHTLAGMLDIVKEKTGFEASEESFREHIRKRGLSNIFTDQPMDNSTNRKRRERDGEDEESRSALKDQPDSTSELTRSTRRKISKHHTQGLNSPHPPVAGPHPVKFETRTPLDTNISVRASHSSYSDVHATYMEVAGHLIPARPLFATKASTKPNDNLREQVLFAVQDFITGLIESPHTSQAPTRLVEASWALDLETVKSRILRIRSQPTLTLSLPHSAFELVEHEEHILVEASVLLLVTENPGKLAIFFTSILRMEAEIWASSALHILEYVLDLCEKILGIGHPLTVLFDRLTQIDSGKQYATVEAALNVLYSTCMEKDSIHRMSLCIRIQIELLKDLPPHGQLYKDWTNWFGKDSDPPDDRSIMYLQYAAPVLMSYGRYDEACVICQTLVARLLEKGTAIKPEREMMEVLLHMLAEIERRRGRIKDAVGYLRGAIESPQTSFTELQGLAKMAIIETDDVRRLTQELSNPQFLRRLSDAEVARFAELCLKYKTDQAARITIPIKCQDCPDHTDSEVIRIHLECHSDLMAPVNLPGNAE